jgi:hypothetical protein
MQRERCLAIRFAAPDLPVLKGIESNGHASALELRDRLALAQTVHAPPREQVLDHGQKPHWLLFRHNPEYAFWRMASND